MHIHTHTHTHVHKYTYVHIHTYTYIYIKMAQNLCVVPTDTFITNLVCVGVYMYKYLVYEYVCMCVHWSVRYVCTYVYTCIMHISTREIQKP